MSGPVHDLIERTVNLAQEFLGGVVEGAFGKAKKAVAKNAAALAVGVTGLVIGLVFLAVAAVKWLETVTARPWTAPLVVGLVFALVGFLGFKFLSNGGSKT